VKRPSLGSILLALIPFIAVCFSVSLWDRINPTVFWSSVQFLLAHLVAGPYTTLHVGCISVGGASLC
jgi:hypothetical protein